MKRSHWVILGLTAAGVIVFMAVTPAGARSRETLLDIARRSRMRVSARLSGLRRSYGTLTGTQGTEAPDRMAG